MVNGEFYVTDAVGKTSGTKHSEYLAWKRHKDLSLIKWYAAYFKKIKFDS